MHPFTKACKNGNLKLAKKIHDRMYAQCMRQEGYSEISKFLRCLDDAFRWACHLGNLETAKWLWPLGGINHCVVQCQAFRNACHLGHLEVAKWVWSLGDINHHSDNEDVFRSVYYNEHLDVAKWIFFLDDKFHNDIPDKILNDVLKVNIFENNQMNLIENYTNLIIS